MAQSTSYPGPTREWRLVLAFRVVALLAGIAVAYWTAHLGRNGQGLVLSMAVFGLTALVGTAVGETVVRPRPAPGVRTASLAPRRIRDHLPRTWPIVAVEVVVAFALLTFTTLTASDDEMGRARELACTTSQFGQAHGPYPGAFYSVPLLVTLLVVLAVSAGTARQVVLRPRGMARSEAGEDRLRRDSLDLVVSATGVAVGAPLVGVCVTAGGAMTSLATMRPSCAPGWMAGTGLGVLVLGLVVLGSVSFFLGRLVLKPSPRA